MVGRAKIGAYVMNRILPDVELQRRVVISFEKRKDSDFPYVRIVLKIVT